MIPKNHGRDLWHNKVHCAIADIEGLLDLRNLITHTPADIEHFVRRLRTVLVAGAGEINGQTFPRVYRSFTDFITSAGAGYFG